MTKPSKVAQADGKKIATQLGRDIAQITIINGIAEYAPVWRYTKFEGRCRTHP